MELSRSAGILLHPTSLPSGKLDRDAYRFVDWLAAAGQSWWQMLPLGPPDEFGSPYRSPSAFAASPQLLARAGREGHGRRGGGLRRAASVLDGRLGALRRRGRARRPGALRAGVGSAARVRGRARRPAHRRPADLRLRRAAPTTPAGRSCSRAARSPARRPTRSARPASAGGTRSTTGPSHRATGFRWWRERFRRTFELVDLCRIDHFRGFVSYWAIPARNSTAKAGRWRPGPGAELFRRGRARARRPAADRRGSRPHHPAGRAAARRARPAGDGRAPLGLPPRPRQPASRSRTTAATRSSTRAPTTPTPPPAGSPAPPARARCDRPRPERAALGADRARVLVSRRAGDRARAGRARARQRRAG